MTRDVAAAFVVAGVPARVIQKALTLVRGRLNVIKLKINELRTG